MEVTIRRFRKSDVPKKVKWINNPINNKYLHYELPLTIDKTEKWFENNKDNPNRYDAVIEADGNAIGIIGLLNIDRKKKDAEYYITIGESGYSGKGIARKASELLLKLAFSELQLNKVYLFTEQGNKAMQRLAERLGMLKESLLMKHSYRDGHLYNVFFYSILKEDFENKIHYPSSSLSNIDYMYSDEYNNNVFMKRDDLISFSFGGNKSRKAKYFFEEIIKGGYQTVVTYGSKVSNHSRVISNLCKKNNIKSIIISPKSSKKKNFNDTLVKLNDSEVIEVDVKKVSDKIDEIIARENEKNNGKTYFIPGGGHGDLGTQAYVDAYHEIEVWSRKNNIHFDYLFLASGTGTTQAGLVIGKNMHQNYNQKIVGISVAREKDYGSRVIGKSIEDYIKDKSIAGFNISEEVLFYDNLTVLPYGEYNKQIMNIVKQIYQNYGIALSTTYTGKAFTGMLNYLTQERIKNKNILFINTGGIPLFFDDIQNTVSFKE